MNTYTGAHPGGLADQNDWQEVLPAWRRMTLGMLEGYNMKRGLIFGGMLLVALAAFEIFNFSTTDFALTDFLGDERFLRIRWATILAIAFCGIDFAGLARLFTPEQGKGEPLDVQSTWYLLGAWFLGATLNAMATWWAVTLSLLGRNIGNEVLSRADLLTYVPVLVAVLVWLTRILIIGTFSVAGERLFTQVEKIVRETRRAPAAVQPPSRRAAPAGVPADSPGTPARIIGASQPAREPAHPSAAHTGGDARPVAALARRTFPAARPGNNANGAKGIE